MGRLINHKTNWTWGSVCCWRETSWIRNIWCHHGRLMGIRILRLRVWNGASIHMAVWCTIGGAQQGSTRIYHWGVGHRVTGLHKERHDKLAFVAHRIFCSHNRARLIRHQNSMWVHGMNIGIKRCTTRTATSAITTRGITHTTITSTGNAEVELPSAKAKWLLLSKLDATLGCFFGWEGDKTIALGLMGCMIANNVNRLHMSKAITNDLANVVLSALTTNVANEDTLAHELRFMFTIGGTAAARWSAVGCGSTVWSRRGITGRTLQLGQSLLSFNSWCDSFRGGVTQNSTINLSGRSGCHSFGVVVVVLVGGRARGR
eukprot:m.142931 g.142931  ORF g.142931 m.142931 type:complete len:317 (+) comp16006_c4_seq1:105-1055(+)